jgi:hypothetical protein
MLQLLTARTPPQSSLHQHLTRVSQTIDRRIVSNERRKEFCVRSQPITCRKWTPGEPLEVDFHHTIPCRSIAGFTKKSAGILGRMRQIHGVVPHYLYLALRTNSPDRPLAVHNSSSDSAPARSGETSTSFRGRCPSAPLSRRDRLRSSPCQRFVSDSSLKRVQLRTFVGRCRLATRARSLPDRMRPPPRVREPDRVPALITSGTRTVIVLPSYGRIIRSARSIFVHELR